MAYTSNVPQASQTFPATQPLINANFGFLSTGIGQEHNFNASGSGTDMYHLRASMPNQSDPSSLTAPVTGIYYVQGGFPKFYNGTAYKIQLTNTLQLVLTGNVTITDSFGTTTPISIPARSAGQYFLYSPSDSNFVNTVCAIGQFVTDIDSLRLTDLSDKGISNSTSGLDWLAKVTSSGNAGTYKYLLVYYTP